MAKQKKVKNHKVLIPLASLAVIATLGLGLAPSILSTQWGKTKLLNALNKDPSKHIELDSLTLNWMGPQHLEGISYKDTKQGAILSSPKIETDASLWALLFKKIGLLRVTSPALQITPPPQTAIASSTESPAAPKKNQKKDESFSPPFYGVVIVENGSISLVQQRGNIIFQDVNLDFHLPKKEEITLNAKGKTAQDNVVGTFSLEASFHQEKNETPSVNLKGNFKNLPVKGIDEILSLGAPELKGALIDAVGNSMDFQINAQISPAVFNVGLNLKSEIAEAAILTQTNPGFISLKTPGIVDFKVSKALLEKFFPIEGISIPNGADVKITLSELNIPFSSEKLSFPTLGFKANVEVLPFLLKSETSQKQFSLNGIYGNVSASNLSEKTNFSLETQVEKGNVLVNGSILNKELGDTSIKINNIPSSFLDSFAEGNVVSKTLGSSLSANIQITSEARLGHFSLATPKLKIPGGDFLYDKGFSLQKEAPFSYILTPEILPDLKNNAPMEGVLTQLNILGSIETIELESSLKAALIEVKDFPIRNLSANLKINSLNDLKLDLKSDHLNVNVKGAIKDNTFIASSMTPIGITLTKESTSNFVKTLGLPPLLSNTSLKMLLSPLNVPLAPFQLNGLKLGGTFTLSDTLFARKEPLPPLQVEAVNGKLSFDGAKQTLIVLASGELKDEAHAKGLLNLDLALSNLLLENRVALTQAKIDAKLVAENIRSNYLTPFLPNDIPLEKLMGDNISFLAHLTGTPDNRNLSLKSQSSLLTANLALNLTPNNISLSKNEPMTLSWTMTPEAYNFLNQGTSAFKLKNKAKVDILVNQLTSPLPFTSKDLKIEADLKIEKISILADREELLLEDIGLSFSKKAAHTPLEVKGSMTSSSKGKEGSLNIAASLENIEQHDLSQVKTKTAIKIQQFPSQALDFFLKMFGQAPCSFSCLFGNAINGTIDADIKNLNGSLSVNIYSPNSRLSFNGNMQNGILYLKDPLHAQIAITDELSRYFLEEANPLSISSISSAHPLTLEIEAQGTAIPIHPFKKENLNISTAKLELGKIKCKNEGNINVTLGLLKAQQLTQNEYLNLWFAPAVLHINQGNLDLERTEILIAETYDVALWGDLNLNDEKVNMVLGLTADCLKKSFGIKKLPENYVLHIPLKGSLGHVKINKGKATKKIALLMAWQQRDLAGAIGGGIPGAIFGEVIGKVVPLPDEKAHTPRAKRPYPWEQGNVSEAPKKKASDNPKKAITSKDKPLQQLKKILLN